MNTKLFHSLMPFTKYKRLNNTFYNIIDYSKGLIVPPYIMISRVAISCLCHMVNMASLTFFFLHADLKMVASITMGKRCSRGTRWMVKVIIPMHS